MGGVRRRRGLCSTSCTGQAACGVCPRGARVSASHSSALLGKRDAKTWIYYYCKFHGSPLHRLGHAWSSAILGLVARNSSLLLLGLLQGGKREAIHRFCFHRKWLQPDVVGLCSIASSHFSLGVLVTSDLIVVNAS